MSLFHDARDDKMFKEMLHAFCRKGRLDILSNYYDVLSIFHI